MVIAAAAILGTGCETAFAVDDGASPPQVAASEPTNQALLKKLEAMEQRVQLLESQLTQKGATARSNGSQPLADATGSIKAKDAPKDATKDTPSKTDKTAAAPDPAAAKPDKPAKSADKSTDKVNDKPILGVAASPVPGLSIGAYGEVFFGAVQNPAAGGQWQNSFDARRFVLLPTYAITDNIIFNAEIEFEHAGAGFDNDDKLHGTAEIEQVWVDFKIADAFNWRAPGVDLVPIGYINQHHEPTQFYSVFRPELYNGLIPSTWKVPASSIYGTIVDGLKYQVMLSVSNEDFGDFIRQSHRCEDGAAVSNTLLSRRRRHNRARLLQPAARRLPAAHQQPCCFRQARRHPAGGSGPRRERQRLLFAQYRAARRP